MPQISDEDLFNCAALVYSRWSSEYDALKRVKAERDDGSPDWSDFHETRLKHHTQMESEWRALKERLISQLPKQEL